MHAQPRGQHVEVHLRHAPLMQGIHQQTVDHRPQTGYGLQPLRLQVTETHRDIGAKAEAEGGDPGMVNPRHIFQMAQRVLMQQAGVLIQRPF